MTQKFITSIDKLEQLSSAKRTELKEVTDKFAFRSNDYYLSLIDWTDSDDPIRNLIIPNLHELDEWGDLDPSGEKEYTVMEGVEHKYASTVLLLVSNVCGGICRYCFRKRVFIKGHHEIVNDWPAVIDYIEQHPEVTNILVSGGDPLMLSTNRLADILNRLQAIDHVKIIRLGTKLPAFYPHRIIQDADLLGLIKNICESDKIIYVMSHFNHVREITDEAVQAVRALHRSGAVLTNQTPIIRGINDNPGDLADLFRELSFIGVPPYYVFQCRPAVGNKHYAVPIEEGYLIFEQAKAMVSGLAKRARFTMSHHSGKIEIVGLTRQYIFLKYLRAADENNDGRFMVFERDSRAFWLDDYDAEVESFSLDLFCNR
ncbi:MAG: KamA family radical SAM protein [Sedimentisphaerales bacterium]|nr:KamA family radical SAM protein [Sedimentisphaerales bacterium]